MSDPTNSKPPQGSNRPGEPTGFNWKLFALMSVALLILGLAFFSNGLSGQARPTSYPEFMKAWDQGLVIKNDSKHPFKIVTKDSPYVSIVTGYFRPDQVKGPESTEDTYVFKIPVNIEAQKEDLNAILSENYSVSNVTQLPDTANMREISLSDLRRALAYDEINRADKAAPLTLVTVQGGGTFITGLRKEVTKRVDATSAEGKPIPPRAFAVEANVPLLGEDLRSLINKGGADSVFESDYLKSAIFTFLPVLLVVMLLVFLFRQQMKAAGRGAMSFGKSKARLLTMDRGKVTFKDVAGIQEAKEELFEIVDFLRDPRKFQKLGGSIPKGVLMVGAPGTGKTLLARAIAGEADVPFFSISGSDFVEMFVGVGASRVRDMFEQGKKHAPCLIFIDEIDAVGRHRGHGMGGGHDEREQTLNQLLVEMDGFDTQEGVIIIAATNRPDVLDPALLRPGRFDRQVTVSLPDVNGREEILRVHVKKIKLAANTDLATIARGTPGFSGAELANLINEAALLAARKGMSAVTIAELEEARDKVRWGRERRSLAMSDKERIGTAWHEAGHALLNMLLPHTHPLHKVTIIPRGPYLGATMYLPDGDKYSTQRKEALANLIVTMGGRIAEAFHSDDVSNGASGDIRQATSLARAMVCEWGMSDKLGMVEYGDGDSPVFIGRGDMGGRRVNYSGHTAQVIDEEIKRFIDEAYQQANDILTKNRHTVELIAKALLEYETLDASHLKDIIDHGEMQNPPTTPKPPSIPDEYRKKEVPKAREEGSTDDDGPIPGTVVGAPA